MKMRLVALVIAGGSLFASTASAAQNASQTVTDDVNWAQHVVQAYENYLQQQQQTAALLEQTRQEAARAAQTARENAAELEARLRRIEQAMQVQQQRELENLQQLQRNTFVIVGTITAIALLAMLLLVMVVMRAMNRRVETMLAPLSDAILRLGPASYTGQLGDGSTAVLGPNPTEQATARFSTALSQLERRVSEMERDMPPTTTRNVTAQTPDSLTATGDERAQIAAWLGKGQSYLNLDRPAEALACFDEALALNPREPEALVKKGTALEKLGRLDEALEHYDRAIEADQNMTLAYLCKGGVYNRLERYQEALECYEKALRAQQNSRVA
ncbi:MAG: tetratricopeptide repeat protein [Verrucomicrobiae bacterium]|nr:tetratricopeptide repeat protein [Verrucomicrobiae bacterium]MDW8345107.1 tetratricopeptide repeat protein [Verrucomicrobiae bacterium]